MDFSKIPKVLEPLKKLCRRLLMYVITYAFLMCLCWLVALIAYLINTAQPGTFTTGRETFVVDKSFSTKLSIYTSLENMILGGIDEDGKPTNGIRKMMYDLRYGIIANSQFRAITVLIVVIATVLMGLAMLTGDQNITVKEFVQDILIIFGAASLLLSDYVAIYIDFFYNTITSLANWVMDRSLSAIFDVTGFNYADPKHSTGSMYAPLDVIASIFVDGQIAKRVSIKIVALIYSQYMFFVPPIVISLLWAWVVTINVFAAFVLAKVTIMFSLAILPFFILFTAVDDVGIQLGKKRKLGQNNKSKKFLWNLIDSGILKPWLYLALMSFLAGLLLYALVIENLINIFDFSVRTARNKWDHIKDIFLVGQYLSRVLHTSVPEPVGNVSDTPLMILVLICGLFAFSYLFETLTALIHAISFEPGEGGKQMKEIFGDGARGSGVFGKNNIVGGTVGSAVKKIRNRGLSYAAKYSVGYNTSNSSFDQIHKSAGGMLWRMLTSQGGKSNGGDASTKFAQTKGWNRADITRKQETGKEETRKQETRKQETGKEETRKQETGKEETRKQETGKEETRKQETGKEETRKQETGKEETRKQETRKEESKREERKPEEQAKTQKRESEVIKKQAKVDAESKQKAFDDLATQERDRQRVEGERRKAEIRRRKATQEQADAQEVIDAFSTPKK